MTLRLADVCDLDRVVSFSPLVVDYPDTERYARGAAAILRRVLGSWIDNGRLLELEGMTPDDRERVAMRSTYTKLAEGVPFVASAAVRVRLVESTITIAATIVLDDGTAHPLEVTTGDAAAAIAALGNA